MHLAPFEQVTIGTIVMMAIMLILWVWQLKSRDAGIVDVGWSAGIGLMAVFYALTSDGYLLRRCLLAVGTGLWSFRLAFYLMRDRVLRGEEDGRYARLRKTWKNRAPIYFLLVFEGQAILVMLFSIPLLAVAHHEIPFLKVTDFVGFAILIGAVLGESTADQQLANFRRKSENKGKTFRGGLWRYSRHPNYFFEWLHWWGYVLMALGSSWWWLTLLGPTLMLLFLFKVTGIPETERQAASSRGEDYQEYQRTTSHFIPWFPKE